MTDALAPDRGPADAATPASSPDMRAMAGEFERQRRLYEAILDNTPDLAYVFDRQHRFVYVNRVLLRMWGRTWDEAIGKTCLELGYEPWHAAMHDREIDQVVATGEPLRGVVPFAGTFGPRIYDYIMVPVFGEDGTVEAVAGTTRDITELKENEEALRQADRRKDEFLATLAHELRNPLAPLRNCLSILQMHEAGQDAAAPVDRQHVLTVMERQVGQLVRLVDDLLEVSRITRGALELRPERTTLGALVERAIETSRPLIDAGAHRLEVEVEPADSGVALRVDPVRIGQVLSNLLNNAARYTEPGGRIVIAARRDGDDAVFSVRDNGPGLDRAELERIFEPFTQSARSRRQSQGGLGIGLTLVRTLAALHGGTVSASSQGPGQGSEFLVRLPIPG